MVTLDSEATFVIGRLSRVEEVNDAACALLGYSRAELLRMHGADLVLPEDQRRVGLSVDQMRRGEAEGRRGRLVGKDGRVIRVEVSARPVPYGRVELRVHAVTDTE